RGANAILGQEARILIALDRRQQRRSAASLNRLGFFRDAAQLGAKRSHEEKLRSLVLVEIAKPCQVRNVTIRWTMSRGRRANEANWTGPKPIERPPNERIIAQRTLQPTQQLGGQQAIARPKRP